MDNKKKSILDPYLSEFGKYRRYAARFGYRLSKECLERKNGQVVSRDILAVCRHLEQRIVRRKYANYVASVQQALAVA